MLSQAQRTAILELSAKGVSKREISHVLQLSRLTVRKVLRANSSDVPEIQRAEKAEPYREQILELLASCKGNLVRVHEDLVVGGAVLSYQALTGFCRRQGIGQTPIKAAGQYRAGDRTLCGGAEAKRPQGGGSCPAATVADAAGISARAVPRRGARSRPVWTLRSRPLGANDSAPRGARLLSAAGYGHRSPGLKNWNN